MLHVALIGSALTLIVACNPLLLFSEKGVEEDDAEKNGTNSPTISQSIRSLNASPALLPNSLVISKESSSSASQWLDLSEGDVTITKDMIPSIITSRQQELSEHFGDDAYVKMMIESMQEIAKNQDIEFDEVYEIIDGEHSFCNFIVSGDEEDFSVYLKFDAGIGEYYMRVDVKTSGGNTVSEMFTYISVEGNGGDQESLSSKGAVSAEVGGASSVEDTLEGIELGNKNSSLSLEKTTIVSNIWERYDTETNEMVSVFSTDVQVGKISHSSERVLHVFENADKSISIVDRDTDSVQTALTFGWGDDTIGGTMHVQGGELEGEKLYILAEEYYDGKGGLLLERSAGNTEHFDGVTGPDYLFRGTTLKAIDYYSLKNVLPLQGSFADATITARGEGESTSFYFVNDSEQKAEEAKLREHYILDDLGEYQEVDVPVVVVPDSDAKPSYYTWSGVSEEDVTKVRQSLHNLAESYDVEYSDKMDSWVEMGTKDFYLGEGFDALNDE